MHACKQNQYPQLFYNKHSMVQLVFHRGKIGSSCSDCEITMEIHTKCIISKTEIPCSPVRLYGMTRWATVTGLLVWKNPNGRLVQYMAPSIYPLHTCKSLKLSRSLHRLCFIQQLSAMNCQLHGVSLMTYNII